MKASICNVCLHHKDISEFYPSEVRRCRECVKKKANLSYSLRKQLKTQKKINHFVPLVYEFDYQPINNQ